MTSLTYTLSSLSEKLLPCPFCGSANVALGHDTIDGTYEIVCLGCAASLPAGDVTKEGAITQWIARSGRLRVSDELDAATVERCARELEEFLEAESGAEYGMMSDFDRSALRARNRETQEYISAIRSLIPNSAGDVSGSHPRGEADPAVTQDCAPAGTVSEEELALAICHARFGDHVLADRPSFTEEARALLSQFDVRRRK